MPEKEVDVKSEKKTYIMPQLEVERRDEIVKIVNSFMCYLG